jgi:hypothetical protein
MRYSAEWQVDLVASVHETESKILIQLERHSHTGHARLLHVCHGTSWKRCPFKRVLATILLLPYYVQSVSLATDT